MVENIRYNTFVRRQAILGTYYRMKKLFSSNELKYDFFVFCISLITFEPIKIQTCSASQNDRLNFSFVKDFYVDGGKVARNGRKTAI